MSRLPLALLLVVPAGLLFGIGGEPQVAPPARLGPAPVKLAVVVVFDQMRGDYLERWQPLFGDGGFRRLQTDGAWFVDCQYPYATTTTGPGHASILSGCGGSRHGIINNNWYDRRAGETVYCAASPRYRFVPPLPPEDPPADAKSDAPRKPKEPGNPDRMLSPTVADDLKDVTGGKGKVFGLSLKDRSAVLPTGKRPDGAYWFEGRFVTSTYYRGAVHPWVAEFNRSGRAEGYFGKDWVRFRPDLDYAKFSGPDDGPGEGKGAAQGTTFPHPTTGGLAKVGTKYYTALTDSPFGNELLLAFAKTCIEAEQLGRDDVPDLLTVSFSSNDLIGHTWGPDSQEVLDVTLRSDALMADFLAFLDAKVGKGNYLLLVTTDHGVCPNPEVSAAKGLDAKRIAPAKLKAAAEAFLEGAFGKPATGGASTNTWVDAVEPPHVYLNHRLLRARGIDPDAAAGKLADWCRRQDGVIRAYTRAELLGSLPAGDEFAPMVRMSYHPDRGGDVVLVMKPYYLLDTYTTGTTHGSPHPYDTHAAFLVYGPGIPGGRRTEPVTPLHAAPVVARALGLAPPRDAVYGVPRTLDGPAN